MALQILGDRGDWRKIERNSELIERLNREAKESKPDVNVKSRQEPVQAPAEDAQNTEGYVYIKPINLYLAKEITLKDTNWNNSHGKLFSQTLDLPHKPRLRMPTPRETWDSLFYLQSDLSNPEFKQLYEVMYVQQVTGIDSKGKLVFSTREKLEDCLQQDGWADISQESNITSQGLCNVASTSKSYKQGKNVYFYYPRNGSVARFVAYSDRADLDCYWRPDDSYASLGVRACAEGAVMQNSGGLK